MANKKTPHIQMYDGVPVVIEGSRGIFVFYTECCDCGLTHLERMRVIGRHKLESTTWRHKGRTTYARSPAGKRRSKRLRQT